MGGANRSSFGAPETSCTFGQESELGADCETPKLPQAWQKVKLNPEKLRQKELQAKRSWFGKDLREEDEEAEHGADLFPRASEKLRGQRGRWKGCSKLVAEVQAE